MDSGEIILLKTDGGGVFLIRKDGGDLFLHGKMEQRSTCKGMIAIE
jgi:hypothetical protein